MSQAHAVAVKPRTPAIEEDHATELQNVVTEGLREEVGYKEAYAAPIAAAVVRILRRRMGGRDVYIPAPSATERYAQIRARHAEIISTLGPTKARDVVLAEFAISLRTFYSALNAK